MKSILTAALAAGFLTLGAPGAGAVCERAKTAGTALGVVGGGVVGNVITHGSVIGTLAGAAGGGYLGHRFTGNGCNHVAYYRHHHRYWIDRHGRRHYYRVATR